jgi:transcriptional regulator with XRE-family HTH domain
MTTTGQRIKVAMNLANATQKSLQSATGIDQHTLSDYINDKKSPRIEDLTKIATELRCSVLDLIEFGSLNIFGNTYSDQSSTIQNNYSFDKNFVIDLIKENIMLKAKLDDKI